MMDILDQETVYGTHDDSHVVMSEKVQSLAGSVYQEFERMIKKYDEDVVKDLMPLVVNVLECLDISYTENQEHEVELELLREDNEQLVTQYEREKQLRKACEQKNLEYEDVVEEEQNELIGKVESLESIVRMLELKSKNSSDHVVRLEDKETEMKKEYNKLHERYTELFKTHMDYMERTKILMGTDRLEQLGSARARLPSMNLAQNNRMSGPASYGFSSLETPLKHVNSPAEFGCIISHQGSGTPNTSLKNELHEMQVGPDGEAARSHNKKETLDKGGGWVDGLSPENKTSDMFEMMPELEDLEDISMDPSIGPEGKSKTRKEQRSANTLYQELSFQDSDAIGAVDEGADITANDNFFGMGKEVENLIMENNELLATKNALNIVKDDLIARVDELTSEQEILREEIKSLQAVKSHLKLHVQELEDELKRVKEEAEKNAKANKSDDEEDVPMAQRKRFTRVEMARVLMERNQYKERFMELQEAVRWTEMIRASRNDPALDKKSKQSIWKFFSNLFNSSEKPQRRPVPYVNIRYNAPTHHVSPALDTMRKRSLQDRKRGLDFLDGDITSEKLQQRRASERREQYKQVRAHVKKDDGRMQAYGWSLPAKGPNIAPKLQEAITNKASTSSSTVPVPVPVYCRPLMEKEPGMKIWCAAGVNLTGGRTRDGGSIVGASVFYADIEEEKEKTDILRDEVDKLDYELLEGEKNRKEIEEIEKQLSSLVWICTSTHSISKVTVIDANNPADILESFHVCSSHLLCIASVPGAKESDYVVDEELNKLSAEETNKESGEGTNKSDDSDYREKYESIGNISFVSCAAGSTSGAPSPTPDSPAEIKGEEIKPVLRKETASLDQEPDDLPPETESENIPRRLLEEPTNLVKDGLSEISKENELAYEKVEKMSSVLPTMWLGSQSGSIYVHSAVSKWRRCLHSIKLKDSVLSIVHVRGRVLTALADGTVAIFHRATDGQWDLTNYHLLDLGKPHHSIRCMVVVHSKVWCGYRNKIHVVDPKTMTVEKSFDAHPRKESQVRQMSWIGDGVWVSIRLDSTLRLYHAHTFQHLQDVDIEPYVSKMLAAGGTTGNTWHGSEVPEPACSIGTGTGKLGFSFVRITALLISSNRLWMGTGNGVIISVPLSENAGGRQSSSTVPVSGPKMPGGMVRVYSDSSDKVTPGSFIPYCSMAQAQLSFHGHRDAVKFFVAVPGFGGMSAATSGAEQGNNQDIKLDTGGRKQKVKSMLIMSGGEGYIDFRIGDGEDDDMENSNTTSDGEVKPCSLSRGERSHLIVWQVSLPD